MAKHVNALHKSDSLYYLLIVNVFGPSRHGKDDILCRIHNKSIKAWNLLVCRRVSKDLRSFDKDTGHHGKLSDAPENEKHYQ
jgi:ribose 1,5-bisphosphokinase PhnN